MQSIAGFDLGHGETTVFALNDINDRRFEVLPQPVFSVDSQPTVLVRFTDGRKYWGDASPQAILQGLGEVDTIDLCFKDKPEHMSERQCAAFVDFVKTVYMDAIRLRPQLGESASWWIGCPSGWEDKTRSSYRDLLESAGIPLPYGWQEQVCKESRAAFAYLYEKGCYEIGSTEKGIVVLDFGSSTNDATLAIGVDDNALDPGSPYGANWVDKCLLLSNVRYWDDSSQKYPKEQFIELLKDRNFLFATELFVRKAKESYYKQSRGKPEDCYPDHNTPHFTPLLGRNGKYLGNIVIHHKMMQEILTTPLNKIISQLNPGHNNARAMHNAYPVLPWDIVPQDTREKIGDRSWLELCEDFTKTSLAKLQKYDRTIEHLAKVILTGGASQMPEVRSIVAAVVSNNRLLDFDLEQSTSVAKGLACHGRVFHQTEAFGKAIREHLLLEENADDDPMLDVIIKHAQNAQFCEVLAAQLHSVFLEKINKWCDGGMSGQQLWRSISSSAHALLNSDNFRQTLLREVSKMLTGIDKDVNNLVKDITSEYNIALVCSTSGMCEQVLQQLLEAYSEAILSSIDDGWPAFQDLGESRWYNIFQPGRDDMEAYARQIEVVISNGCIKMLYKKQEIIQLWIGSIYHDYRTMVDDSINATRRLLIRPPRSRKA